MSATITEHELAGIPWLHLAGDRYDAFGLLGQHSGAAVRATIRGLPEREILERFAAGDPGSRAVAVVAEHTERHHPAEMRELRTLADGAGIGFDELLLANLRGDLGFVDGTGCTDLAWAGIDPVVAHNEDGAPSLDGDFCFLTLQLDGLPTVTTQWYPGFAPSNTHAVTSAGLAWGINHLQAPSATAASGRHFMSRALQQCESLNAVLTTLETSPVSGGFAYTIGDLTTGAVVVAEVQSGEFAVHTPTDTDPFTWHSNHARLLPDTAPPIAADTSGLGLHQESVTRGAIAAGLSPVSAPSATWFLRALRTPVDSRQGVHRCAAGADPLATLCSTVVELATATVHVHTNHGSARLSVADYLHPA